MVDSPVIPRRDLRLATRWSAVAVGLFIVVSWLTTQVESTRSVLPFTEDPYDAVVSFALIGIGLVCAVTVIRAVAHRRLGYDPAVARRIAIGAVLATAIAAVAVASDLLAVLVAGVDGGEPGVASALALLVLTDGAIVVAAASAWRVRSVLASGTAGSPAAEPDMLDELGSIVASVGSERVANGFTRWIERSPLSPRRHRVVVGLLGGAAAGVAGAGWHLVREGGSPLAAVIFGVLTALGVGGAYLLCLAPLRLLRPVERDRS